MNSQNDITNKNIPLKFKSTTKIVTTPKLISANLKWSILERLKIIKKFIKKIKTEKTLIHSFYRTNSIHLKMINDKSYINNEIDI
jgi:hypothetical protein